MSSDGGDSGDSTTVNVTGLQSAVKTDTGLTQVSRDGDTDSIQDEGITDIPGILKVHRLIGRGDFSAVYCCSMETFGDVAIKKFSLGVSVRSVIHDLQSLRHPNLVQVLRIDESSLVLELCGRDLSQVLHEAEGVNFPGVADPEERLRTAWGILDAVAYLHANGILHRNISSYNCLAAPRPGSSSRPWTMNFKLGDFALARSAPGQAMTQWTGTLAYMAPEVMAESTYSYPCDVFSTGILLHEIACRMKPYGGKFNPRTTMSVLRGLRPSAEDVPKLPGGAGRRREDFLALLGRCWAGDPKERISAAEAVEELRSLLLTVPGAGSRA